MPTRILIARGSKEALEAMRTSLEYGELFFEKVQPDQVQDGTIVGSGDQVEPAPVTSDK